VIEPLDFLIATLAIWRLASLFVFDEGPGKIFARIRTRAGIEESDPDLVWIPATYWAGLLSCVRCLSLNLGILAVIVGLAWSWLAWPFWILRALALPLAFSAGAILTEVIDHD
jgi:hypothetical protein